LLALALPRDQYHDRATKSLAKARESGVTWVGTMLVLAELHGHLLRYLSPTRAREVIHALTIDETFDWIDVTDRLVQAALSSWMTRFSDQSISLTDAVTFEVMRKERLTVAFAFDRHFVVAGYRLLA
jgi:predicted nucleic acid-binding protein